MATLPGGVTWSLGSLTRQLCHAEVHALAAGLPLAIMRLQLDRALLQGVRPMSILFSSPTSSKQDFLCFPMPCFTF